MTSGGPVAVLVLLASACGGGDAPPPRTAHEEETPPATGLGMRRPAETVQGFGPLAGDAGASETPERAAPADPARPATPNWAGARLAPSNVPEVFTKAWRRARNHARCALLVPSTLAEGEGGSPRGEPNAHGWSVAYDLPSGPGAARDGTTCTTCGRSAFGIRGVAVEVAARFPLRRSWSDGSQADYGREGGDDSSVPRPYVAHLHVEGQDCTYELWSHLGRDHLEHLMEHLQMVDVSPDASR